MLKSFCLLISYTMLSLVSIVIHIDGYPEETIKFYPIKENNPLIMPEASEVVYFNNDVEPIHNRNFTYKFSYLELQSTSHIDLSGYGCKPATFGYSYEEGNKIFPPFTYPNCSTVTNISESQLKIDRLSQTLYINCKDQESGYYFYGPLGNSNFMLSNRTYQFKLNKYKSPVDSKNIEFGLGICSNEKIEKPDEIDPFKIQHADISPIFNKSLFEISKKYVNGKPRLIFMLTLDSLSRRHFYRKLPKLIKFLNESEKTIPHIAVYDFMMHSTIGSDSVANQIPIFGGLNYEEHLDFSKGDRLGTNSIWSKMKSKGYVTAIGFDDCDRWFPEILGESLDTDYTIRQFYCLVKEYIGVKAAKNENEQRCIGPNMTHQYMLKYTLDLIKMYNGVNMWLYLHLNAGHENSGQHAATLDDDVTSFLKSFFILAKNYEIILYLHADHGMRYGNWYRSLDAYQETKLPSMFVLASKNLLNRFPYSYHCLHENKKRLTSKLDIRETTLGLIGMSEKHRYSINWLRNIASYSRNCRDIMSPSLRCACNRMTEAPLDNSTILSLSDQVSWKVQEFLNSISYNHPLHPPGQFCDPWNLDRIFNIYHIGISKTKEMFKFEFGASTHPKVRLEVNIGLGVNETYSQVFLTSFKPLNIWLGQKYLVLVRVI